MTDITRIEILRNAAIALINLADEPELRRYVSSKENGGSEKAVKTKPRKQGDYPSYLYRPLKKYLTENACDWETGKQIWFQVAVLEQAMRETGMLKPADGAQQIQYCLTKNGGSQNAFIESGGLWSLRRYEKAENRIPKQVE